MSCGLVASKILSIAIIFLYQPIFNYVKSAENFVIALCIGFSYANMIQDGSSVNYKNLDFIFGFSFCLVHLASLTGTNFIIKVLTLIAIEIVYITVLSKGNIDNLFYSFLFISGLLWKI